MPAPRTAAALSSSTQDRAAAAAQVLADAERAAGLARRADSPLSEGLRTPLRADPEAPLAQEPRAPRQSPPPPDPALEGSEPDPHDIARAIVLRQLAMAPRSRAQLERRLHRRGCADDVARTVLDRMTEVGLVDDTAYARAVVSAQQATRGLARTALAHRLRADGVDDDLVRDALADVSDDHEREQAGRLAAKKLRSMHGLDATVQARRLAAMLARKGYPSGLVWTVVRDTLAEAPEHQRD